MNKRLEQLLKKQEELKAQIQKIKATEATQKRKEETRQKILLGALVMEMMEKGELDSSVMMKRLDGFLTRTGDRTLFNLPVHEIKSEPVTNSFSVAKPQSFEVIFESFGTNKIKVLKEVENVTGLGLKEAKDLIESAPTLLMKVNDTASAQGIKKQLEEWLIVRTNIDWLCCFY